jgi:hypothetical protein
VQYAWLVVLLSIDNGQILSSSKSQIAAVNGLINKKNK